MLPDLTSVVQQLDRAIGILKGNDLLCNNCRMSFLPEVMSAKTMLQTYIDSLGEAVIDVRIRSEQVSVILTKGQLEHLTQLLKLDARAAFPRRCCTENWSKYGFAEYVKLLTDDLERSRLEYIVAHAHKTVRALSSVAGTSKRVISDYLRELKFVSDSPVFSP